MKKWKTNKIDREIAILHPKYLKEYPWWDKSNLSKRLLSMDFFMTLSIALSSLFPNVPMSTVNNNNSFPSELVYGLNNKKISS